MVYLIAGVVQAAKNAWLKSGVNLVRSLRYIKDFEEGLHFEGPEALFVRSFACFVMGLFNLAPRLLGGPRRHPSTCKPYKVRLCRCLWWKSRARGCEVLSMLPPQMLRVASRAGGRTLQGSRTEALRLLNDCRLAPGS